jgi:hypothetical protein
MFAVISGFLFFILFAAASANVDTILFNDLSDALSITTTSTRVSFVLCGLEPNSEFCNLALDRPGVPPATLLSAPTASITIAEAGSTAASDRIFYSAGSIGPVTTNLVSDVDSGPPFATCLLTDCLRETGGVQTAFQLFWSDGTVDTIQFQSGIAEPPSWTLLLIAFAALQVGWLRVNFPRGDSML